MFLPYFTVFDFLIYLCKRDLYRNKYGDFFLCVLVYASSAVGREQWNNNALRAVVFRRLSARTHKQTYSGVDKATS